MILATRPRPAATTNVCDRCGIDTSGDRTQCRDCYDVVRLENATTRSLRLSRKRARDEGWDWKHPHLDVGAA